MQHRDTQDAYRALQYAELNEREIYSLQAFRRIYMANISAWPPDDLARLQFVRWLVEQGKLNEYA
jgi:hypothetical protein